MLHGVLYKSQEFLIMQCSELSTDFLPLMSRYFSNSLHLKCLYIMFFLTIVQCCVMKGFCFTEETNMNKQLAAHKLSCTKFPNNIGLCINGPF